MIAPMALVGAGILMKQKLTDGYSQCLEGKA